jgi:hypothetical protein
MQAPGRACAHRPREQGAVGSKIKPGVGHQRKSLGHTWLTELLTVAARTLANHVSSESELVRIYVHVSLVSKTSYAIQVDNTMNVIMLGRIGSELAVLSVISIIVIFLFSGMHGPYSVVHGPMTAFRAARAATRLRIAMLQASINIVNNGQICLLVPAFWAAFSRERFCPANRPECASILRC